MVELQRKSEGDVLLVYNKETRERRFHCCYIRPHSDQMHVLPNVWMKVVRFGCSGAEKKQEMQPDISLCLPIT